MNNTSCVAGPAFSIEGDTLFAGQYVSFRFGFGSEAEQGEVLLFEWYLNRVLVVDVDTAEFAANLWPGSYTIGGRLLTADGWSGYKEVAFDCEGLILSYPEAIAEGSTGTFGVSINLPDGSFVDVTSEYVFTATEGSFDGPNLTIPANNVFGDTRQATATATKGAISISAPVYIEDTTEMNGDTLYIDGNTELSPNAENTYTYQLILSHSNNTTQNVTASASGFTIDPPAAGTFNANVLTLNAAPGITYPFNARITTHYMTYAVILNVTINDEFG